MIVLICIHTSSEVHVYYVNYHKSRCVAEDRVNLLFNKSPLGTSTIR